MAGSVAANVQVTIDARDEGALDKLIALKKAAGELGVAFNAVTRQGGHAASVFGGFGRDASGAFAGAIEGATGLRTVLAQVAIGYEAVHAASAFLREGFTATSGLEQARLGIAAEIAAAATIRDASGKALEGQAKIAAATGEAGRQMKALQADAQRVGIEATTLADIFTKSVAPALRGGGNLENLRSEVTNLALLGRTLGVPYERISTTLLQILNGHVQQRNQLVAILGITNAELKTAQERGDIQDLLNKKLAAYGELAGQADHTLRGIGERLKEEGEEAATSLAEPIVRSIEERIGPKLKEIGPVLKSVATSAGTLLGDAFNAAVTGAEDLAHWLHEHSTEVGATLSSMKNVAGQLLSIGGDAAKVAVSLAGWVASPGAVSLVFETIAGTLGTIRDIGHVIAQGFRLWADDPAIQEVLSGLRAIGAELARTKAAEQELERTQIAAHAGFGEQVAHGAAGTSESGAHVLPGISISGNRPPPDPAKGLREASEEAAAALRAITEQMRLDEQEAKDRFAQGLDDAHQYYTKLAQIAYDGLQRQIDIKEQLRAKETDPGKRAALLTEIETLNAEQLAIVKHYTAEEAIELAKLAKKQVEAQRAAISEGAQGIQSTLSARVADVHAQVDVGTITKAQGAQQLASAYAEALTELQALYAEAVRFAAVNDDQKAWNEVERIRTAYAHITIEAQKALASSNEFVNALAQAAGRAFGQIVDEIEHARRAANALRAVARTILADLQHAVTETIGKKITQTVQHVLTGGADKKGQPLDASALKLDAASGKLSRAADQVSAAAQQLAGAAPGASDKSAGLLGPFTSSIPGLSSVLSGVAGSASPGGGPAGGVMALLGQFLGGGGGGGGSGAGIGQVLGPLLSFLPALLAKGGPVGWARFDWGGPVHGPGTGTSDSVPAWLSHGEHVLTSKDVTNMGGHAAVYAMREHAARRASGGEIKIPRFAVRSHYAEGGSVWAHAQRFSSGGHVSPAPSGGPRGGEHHLRVELSGDLTAKQLRSRNATDTMIEIIGENREGVKSALQIP